MLNIDNADAILSVPSRRETQVLCKGYAERQTTCLVDLPLFQRARTFTCIRSWRRDGEGELRNVPTTRAVQPPRVLEYRGKAWFTADDLQAVLFGAMWQFEA
jgi:hypothetical protein